MSKVKYILLFFVLVSVKTYSQCKTGNCNNGRGTYDFGWCIYAGQFKDGKPDGKGIIVYDDYSFEGEFKNGVEDGKGVIAYKNGNIEVAFYYKGTKQKQTEKVAAGNWKELEGKYTECVSGNCNNGFGTVEFPSGNKYVGNFVNRKRQGKGVFYYNNGDVFDGTWNADEKQNGTYTFTNGYTYNGSFVNDNFYNGTFGAPSGSSVALNNGKVVTPPTAPDDDDDYKQPANKVKSKKSLDPKEIENLIKNAFASQKTSSSSSQDGWDKYCRDKLREFDRNEKIIQGLYRGY